MKNGYAYSADESNDVDAIDIRGAGRRLLSVKRQMMNLRGKGSTRKGLANVDSKDAMD
jgi:hypothetical protein